VTKFIFSSFPQQDQDTEDLEQDLKDVVKKVHLRIILKEHVKLKTLKLPEPAAHAPPPGPPVARESRTVVESSVLRLIPCAKDVSAFQCLGFERWLWLLLLLLLIGSFKNMKPIGEVGGCDSRMAERIH